MRLLRSTIVTRFFANMSLSDSRPVHLPRLFIPTVDWVGFPSPYRRVSQVSRRIFPCALSPTTPESPVDANSRFFSTGVRLHPLWQAGRLSICVTRPNRVHLRYGSQVHLARLRQIGLLHLTLAWLHVERVIHMVDSFHSTRFASFTGTPETRRTQRRLLRQPRMRGFLKRPRGERS